MEDTAIIRNVPAVIQCFSCRKEVTIMVTEESLIARNKGAKVQDAFPFLTANEREMFVSRMCPKCYDEMCRMADPEGYHSDLQDNSEEETEEDEFTSFFDTVIVIDIGTKVLCDYCNKEYTPEDGITGGILFNRDAVCPDCSPRIEKAAHKYEEMKFVKHPNQGETFYNFVMRMR